MSKHRNLILPAVLLGVVLLALAVLYVAEPASGLPSFIPGHQAGSSHHHVKHGIAAAALGVGSLIYAWFQLGPSTPGRPPRGT